MKKTISAELTLLSPSGKTRVPALIQYDDDEDAAYPLSQITIVYNGAEYSGKGTDYLWEGTFAELQAKLPSGVKLACCMTCRHGNLCPYGNTPNRLFCMKDITADSKDVLCNVFDTTDAYEKRAVSFCGICDDFVYQSDDYFTYNDFLHHLRRV